MSPNQPLKPAWPRCRRSSPVSEQTGTRRAFECRVSRDDCATSRRFWAANTRFLIRRPGPSFSTSGQCRQFRGLDHRALAGLSRPLLRTTTGQFRAADSAIRPSRRNVRHLEQLRRRRPRPDAPVPRRNNYRSKLLGYRRAVDDRARRRDEATERSASCADHEDRYRALGDRHSWPHGVIRFRCDPARVSLGREPAEGRRTVAGFSPRRWQHPPPALRVLLKYATPRLFAAADTA